MTVENEGAQPANDAVVTDDKVVTAEHTEATEGLETEGEEAQQDDDEELDLDGEKFRIPRKVREAIAKPFQQDYSRKTEEVATGRKALETDRESFTRHQETQRTHFQEAVKVHAFNDQIKSVDASLAEYAKVDWATLSQTNPGLYEHHRVQRDMLRDQKEALKEQRDTAARAWTDKEQEYSSSANREYGERVAKATAEIAKQVEGWAPGNELDLKLVKYGNSKGLSDKDMGELAIRTPVLVKLLNEHRVFSEAAAKAKTQQTFEKTQQAQPVTRVGGNGGSASRRTTDSSGDQLSDAEWAKRENERVRKKA